MCGPVHEGDLCGVRGVVHLDGGDGYTNLQT